MQASGAQDETESRLIWVDLEMSGLDAERERILEVAVLVTNADLRVVAEGPNLVVNQPDSVLDAMDSWNAEHHFASGLTARVRASSISEKQAEEQLLAFVSLHCMPRKCALAGNTVHQDRKFLERYMPAFERFLHYRNVDVSTLKELVRRWYPHVYKATPPKGNAHRALEDIYESLRELSYYREKVFV